MTNSNTPIEAFEHIYPARIVRYALRRTGGWTVSWRRCVIREIRFTDASDRSSDRMLPTLRTKRWRRRDARPQYDHSR
jgi:hypothetical protein